MDIFPTQYSTLSSSALKDSVEKSYGFSGLTCRFLLHGVSDTYVLEDSQPRYVLKIYRSSHRSLEEIKGEVELLNILNEQGAKVSHPVRAVDGEQIQAFTAAEGIRHGVLFYFASGKSVYDFTDEQLRVIGNEMAVNHNITSRIELSHERKKYNIETMLHRPLRLVKPWFTDGLDDYHRLLELGDQVEKKMATLTTSAFSYGYCHYDYLPKNFHFDGDTFTLFDFDFAGKGFLANDLASFLIHFFIHSATGRLTKEEGDRQFAVFIDGYKEVRALSDEELDAIPFLGVLFWIFYVGFAAENFDDWSNYFLSPRYLKERVAVINRFADMYCQF
ncbi:phosphotransferase enzyme family protein [Spirosoma agri]|uniref:Phosphotransferase n=1 Tax=Spirosoma agri TaxID=1987381 RepID=A0A6M0IMA1_9BACT|nr:phosphotransferase [Spirosoma agri]NEU68521.1 phosphotransferase [Spirosoma agri]